MDDTRGFDGSRRLVRHRVAIQLRLIVQFLKSRIGEGNCLVRGGKFLAVVALQEEVCQEDGEEEHDQAGDCYCDYDGFGDVGGR